MQHKLNLLPPSLWTNNPSSYSNLEENLLSSIKKKKKQKSQHAGENPFMYTQTFIILFMCKYHNIINTY